MNLRDRSRGDPVLHFFPRQKNAGKRPDCCISQRMHSRWAQLYLSSLPLSLSFSVTVIGLPLPDSRDSLYLHTSTNPEFFHVSCFSIARVHAGLASADLELAASGSLFLLFSLFLFLSLICTQYTRPFLQPANGRKLIFFLFFK